MWRARKLTRDFRALRRRIFGFQRHCRGFITRRRFRRRMYSIIKLQSHFRRLIAVRRVNHLRIEKKKREEAERLRREEEERLMREMQEEEARKEAERLHQVRVTPDPVFLQNCMVENFCGGILGNICVVGKFWGVFLHVSINVPPPPPPPPPHTHTHTHS